MRQLTETVRKFQREYIGQGPVRARVLQKALAGGLAYAAPVTSGDTAETMQYYRQLCYPHVLEITSRVNELVVINTSEVANDIQNLWSMRYLLLNCPRTDLVSLNFFDTLKAGTDITNDYNYWSGLFLKAIRNDLGLA